MAALLFILIVCAVVELTSVSIDSVSRERLLGFALLFVLGVVVARFVDQAIACCQASSEISRVADRLMDERLKAGDIVALVADYEYAIKGAPYVPTWVYRAFNKGIEAKWREQLKAIFPPSGPMPE